MDIATPLATIIILILFIVVLILGINFFKIPNIPLSVVSQLVTPVPVTTTHIKVGDTAVAPKAITIAEGTQITWTNTGTENHDISSSAFGTHTLKPGDTFAYSFMAAGQYTYASDASSTPGTITVVVKS